MTDEQPYAEIKRLGRFTYSIYVIHGTLRWGAAFMGAQTGRTAWGRKSAERKARRALDLYRRHQERQADVWKVSR